MKDIPAAKVNCGRTAAPSCPEPAGARSILIVPVSAASSPWADILQKTDSAILFRKMNVSKGKRHRSCSGTGWTSKICPGMNPLSATGTASGKGLKTPSPSSQKTAGPLSPAIFCSCFLSIHISLRWIFTLSMRPEWRSAPAPSGMLFARRKAGKDQAGESNMAERLSPSEKKLQDRAAKNTG